MNRILSKIAKEVKASANEMDEIIGVLEKGDVKAKKVFREFADAFEWKLEDLSEDESNYDDEGYFYPELQDITEKVFADDPDFSYLTEIVYDLYEDEKSEDEIDELLDEAYKSSDVQDVISEKGEIVWADKYNKGESDVIFKMTDHGSKKV